MKRILLLLPLLVVPPALTAAYFLHLAPPSMSHATDILSTPDANLRAARAAHERASRLFSKARTGKGKEKELLQQAIIQYRICLAYENATPDDGRLFEDARHNLEASRLLLVQHNLPPTPTRRGEATTVLVTGSPPVELATPITRSESKSPPSPAEKTAMAREPEAESKLAAMAKPLTGSAEPDKSTAVGPDGITFDPVENKTPAKE
jgi:hypothetical protein